MALPLTHPWQRKLDHATATWPSHSPAAGSRHLHSRLRHRHHHHHAADGYGRGCGRDCAHDRDRSGLVQLPRPHPPAASRGSEPRLPPRRIRPPPARTGPAMTWRRPSPPAESRGRLREKKHNEHNEQVSGASGGLCGTNLDSSSFSRSERCAVLVSASVSVSVSVSQKCQSVSLTSDALEHQPQRLGTEVSLLHLRNEGQQVVQRPLQTHESSQQLQACLVPFFHEVGLRAAYTCSIIDIRHLQRRISLFLPNKQYSSA